jgi:4-amino-4-deoxy-L-arabinose transferase-like glycosyltransferase
MRSGSRTVLGAPWPAVAIAAAVVGGLLLLAPLYGWHRDELYFVVAGRHPALGYVDQPPLTPLVSAAAVALLGPTPAAVRILAALAMGAMVLLAALIARDLGGSRRAQVLASLTVGISGLLAAGHIAATATYDLLAWTIVLALVVRLLRGADPRLWLAVGLVAGIGLQNKHIILFLGAGLAAGLLLARRWDVIRSPWAWGAVGLAVLIWLPNLAWQAANGWPQLEMARSIAEDAGGEPATVLVELALLAGPLLFVVALAGGAWLLAGAAARPWRTLGWCGPVILLLVLVVGGKSYYAAGLLPLLIAAGAIVVDGWLARGQTLLRPAAFEAAASVSGVLAALLVLPVVPASALGSTPIPEIYKESAEQLGWAELVGAVEGAVGALPQASRDRAVIVTNNYGEAGALELLGRDLPPVYSGHNAYWDWGPPPTDRPVVVTVGWSLAEAARVFSGCRAVAVIDNGLGIANQEQDRAIAVCDAVRRPWPEVWPEIRHLG